MPDGHEGHERRRDSDAITAGDQNETTDVFGAEERTGRIAEERCDNYDKTDGNRELEQIWWDGSGRIVKRLGFYRELQMLEHLFVMWTSFGYDVQLFRERQAAHQEPDHYQAPEDPPLEMDNLIHPNGGHCNWILSALSIGPCYRPSWLVLSSTRNVLASNSAVILKRMALSECLAISKSKLTEFASNRRSPAETG